MGMDHTMHATTSGTRAIHALRGDEYESMGPRRGATPTEAMAVTLGSLLAPSHGYQLLQTAKKPNPFSGRYGSDWQQFVREWKPYERLLERAYPRNYGYGKTGSAERIAGHRNPFGLSDEI